jgi:crotonobetainyl-CoA:carnitine CoA-transferase CaiB-like acyl-CoA transferase
MTSEQLPLSGIRVVELGRVFAAPWVGLMLADLGADVIKVEEPRGGDMMRGLGPGFVRDASGAETRDSAKFQSLNRNKRSITVDISRPEGQEIVRALAAAADVFLENFKAGDLARYGLGYGDLKALNDRLVYLSITGFGQTGPYRRRPAFDAVGQAYSGFMSVNGEAGSEPLRSTVNVMDFSTAMFGVVAVMGALMRRVGGGGGQHIDVSMVDSGLSMMSYSIMSSWLSGVQPPRSGSKNVDWVPSGNYRCADGLIYIVSGSDKDFAQFCKAIERPDLPADARLSTRPARNVNRAIVDDLLAQLLPQKSRAEWVRIFSEHGVVAAPVYEFADILSDPHIAERQSIVNVPHDAGGSVPLIRNPIRYSNMPVFPEEAAPLLGADTEQVLRDELQYSDSKIEALRKARIV